jgi:hypothetical protein
VRYEEWRRRAEGSQPVKSTRLVTDVNMRGSLHAFGVARLVTNLWPDMGIAVVSGHTLPRQGGPAEARLVP